MRTEEQTRAQWSQFLAKLLLLLLAAYGAIAAQSANIGKPGVKGVQVPFTSLRPTATFKIGRTADWVLVTDNAVGSQAQNLTPCSASIRGRTGSSQESPCPAKRAPASHSVSAVFGFRFAGKSLLSFGSMPGTMRSAQPFQSLPQGREGGITTSTDSVWMVITSGTLNRIDPLTNSVGQKISIPPGSYNPIFSHGIVWITGVEGGVLTAVNADSGEVLNSLSVGPKPRFLIAGSGSVWTLNQGDGTVTRVDEKSRKVLATIQVGIPGTGGDIGYGADSVWPTVFDVPLTRVEAATNKVVKQWLGKGGDSLRFGFGSIWITDYKKGLLSRIPEQEVLQQ